MIIVGYVFCLHIILLQKLVKSDGWSWHGLFRYIILKEAEVFYDGIGVFCDEIALQGESFLSGKGIMKFFFVFGMVLTLSVLAGLPAAENEKTVVWPEKISYQISMSDTFEVVPKPGWTMYPQKELPLRFGEVLIRGKDDSFSLELIFICDTDDLAELNTPDKMKRILEHTAMQYFNTSLEKARNDRVLIRPFAPGGRYGFAVRFTDKKYVESAPPKEEWKYLTCGIFRLSKDSALMFTLLANSVDNAEYLELLDYIASFGRPESGEGNWKIVDGKQAAEIAAAEFPKIYSADALLTQRPYTVVRKGNQWLVHGNMWVWHPGDVAEIEIDGASGKILKLQPSPSR